MNYSGDCLRADKGQCIIGYEIDGGLHGLVVLEVCGQAELSYISPHVSVARCANTTIPSGHTFGC